jgi:hypothetical protein
LRDALQCSIIQKLTRLVVLGELLLYTPLLRNKKSKGVVIMEASGRICLPGSKKCTILYVAMSSSSSCTTTVVLAGRKLQRISSGSFTRRKSPQGHMHAFDFLVTSNCIHRQRSVILTLRERRGVRFGYPFMSLNLQGTGNLLETT